jgi:ABC-2 type transport system ATP-binding protein
VASVGVMKGQPMANTAISTKGLIKFYGDFQALFGVDLEVGRGEIFGFLGPNGAGKTTTIRCLLDLIRPNGGTVRVLGIDPQVESVEVRARVGYLPGELHLDENRTVEGSLRYFNDIRASAGAGRGAADWGYVEELGERLDLDLKQTIKNLSKGNKQKVGVMQALMHRPELLIMDEPTSGLDPLIQQEVHRLLREAQQGGATIFFSSHVMSEVEAVANRVGIIRQGVVVETAETESLINRALRQVRVRFKEPANVSLLGEVAGVEVLSQDDGQGVMLQVAGDMDGLIKALASFAVSDFETHRPTLEEIFLAYYESAKEDS